MPSGDATALRAGASSGMDVTVERVATSTTSAVERRSSTVSRRAPSALGASPVAVRLRVPTTPRPRRSTTSMPRGVGTKAVVRRAFTTGTATGGRGRATPATTAEVRMSITDRACRSRRVVVTNSCSPAGSATAPTVSPSRRISPTRTRRPVSYTETNRSPALAMKASAPSAEKATATGLYPTEIPSPT